jgi:putative ABC transport system permease protein
MSQIWQNFRYAGRRLIKNPGYTALAVLLLAIGIGVNTTVFSVMDCLVLRPMPLEKPRELATLYVKRQNQYQSFSYPEFEEIRRQSASYKDILAYSRRGAVLYRDGETEIIRADVVSENYFSVLGIRPLMGQPFTAEGKWKTGDMPQVVVSDGLWQRIFGSDPGAVGKTVIVNGESAVIRGIAPPSFGGLQRGMLITEMWLPAGQWPSYGNLQNREYRDFHLLGRLKSSTKLETARVELDTIAHRLALSYPETNGGTTYYLEALEKSIFQNLILGSLVQSGPFLILIICCANVAGIGLAKTEQRSSELAVRLSLGAGPRRLLLEFFAESLLLAIPGAGLGLVLTYWLIGLQSRLMPPLQPIMRFDLRVDMRVLFFAIGASLLAVLLSGLTPALQAAKTDLSALLKRAPGRTESRKYGSGFRNIFVAGQIALSLTLIIAGGLFLKSLLLSKQINPGFDAKKRLLIVAMAPSVNVWESNQRVFLPAIERIKSLPGVKTATYAMRMLLSDSGGGVSSDISIPGIENPPGQKGFIIKHNSVGRDYFQTVGTKIIRGRAFTKEDEFPDRRTVIINEEMAGRFWPNADPIGGFVTVRGRDYQIIGIAQDGTINRIHEIREPYVYLPFAQFPFSNASIIVETAGDPLELAAAVKQEIRSADKSVTFLQTETLKDLMGLALYTERIAAIGSGALGVLGILLNAAGLYAILAYVARRRTHEIGIRIALGATQQNISKLVVGKGFRLSLIGIAAGLIVSFIVTRLLGSLLYGVAPTDIWIFSGGALAVLAVSLLASYLPARRAARVDPSIALRNE